MPKMNPTIHEFANLYTQYRSYGVTPIGWREINKPTESIRCALWTVLSGKKKFETPLTQLKYSLTKISQCACRRRKLDGKELLTMTVPNLPIRSWWPHDREFYAPEGVKVIIFEMDGYRLERDPEYEKLVSNNRMVATAPRLKPVVLDNGDRDIPKMNLDALLLDVEEGKDTMFDRDEVLDPNSAQVIKKLQAEYGELF